MTKEFNLGEKRQELERAIKQRENPLLSFGLNVLHTVEAQDKEFIKLLKKYFKTPQSIKFIDKLAGDKFK